MWHKRADMQCLTRSAPRTIEIPERVRILSSQNSMATSDLGRSRRFADVCVTSAYPARAAAKRTLWHFAFVPSEPVSKALRCR